MAKIIIHYTGNADSAPEYSSLEAAGADLRAFIEDDVILGPGEREIIPTGLHLQIPAGYEGQVRPRSGLAFKHGITVLNTPGTIDSDYRGEVRVILINLSKKAYTIKNGDRIAQILFSEVIRGEFMPAEELEISDRGTGGFGSTGV
ncbi:MAG: dUTP diphosphatase [Spirochaetales bacterium]|nr:dUTP diphosphatase [Spirochaetales bacterium]